MAEIATPFLDGFKSLVGFFHSQNIRYCLIGGIAAGFWGEPRFTKDMDFTVASRGLKPGALALKLTKAGYKVKSISSAQMQVLGKGKKMFQADLIPAETDYQDWVVQRAIPVKIFGVNVPICTAEDLIVLKMIAGRRQDDLDVENILKKVGARLDKAYLMKWLEFWGVTKRFQKEFGK